MERDKEILRVVDRIHAAALSPDGWSDALADIVDLLGADHASVIAVTAEGGTLAVASGLSESELKGLCTEDALRSAGGLMALMPPGIVLPQHSVFSDADWSRMEYYNEFIRPLGAFYGVGFWEKTPAMIYSLGACRPRRFRAFDDGVSATAQVLVPHFTTALELQRRLRSAEYGYTGFVSLIDRLDVGVIVTDATARPLHVNARAARIVADADGLFVNGTVAAATPAVTRHLVAAVAGAASEAAIERRLRLPRPSQRPALLLSLLPIGRLGVEISGLPAPRVAIFVNEPDAPPELDRIALADSFGLTVRESEVAVLLAAGLDLAGVAARLELGIGTVRNHLKRAFDKTGTRSQSALVAALRGFTEWLQ